MDFDQDVLDALLAGVQLAVVVGVVIDVAAEGGRFGFGEIVVHAVVTAQQRDVADYVHAADHAASHATGGRADAVVSRRLGFHHAVRTGQHVLEDVIAVVVGVGGLSG